MTMEIETENAALMWLSNTPITRMIIVTDSVCTVQGTEYWVDVYMAT